MWPSRPSGDATNLTGGTLLVTPLLAADGEVYAVAQGALATGAIAAKGAASSVTRGVPTSARIANGATVEREVAFRLDKTNALRLGLRNPDLTTARRIADGDQQRARAGGQGDRSAHCRARTWRPRPDRGAWPRIEDLRVEPDNAAIVVIEESSGTIVMGANVRISTVAIAQGNLTIRVTETPEVSQPAPLSERHHRGRAAHADPGGRPARPEAGHPAGQRDVARPGGQPERARASGRAT